MWVWLAVAVAGPCQAVCWWLVPGWLGDVCTDGDVEASREAAVGLTHAGLVTVDGGSQGGVLGPARMLQIVGVVDARAPLTSTVKCLCCARAWSQHARASVVARS